MTLQLATPMITFRFGDEDFKIIWEVVIENGKVVYVSNSTQLFFNYLQKLHLVSSTEEIFTWLNSSENITLEFFNSRNSFKIRKKAHMLGLKVIPGVIFQERKDNALKSKCCF